MADCNFMESLKIAHIAIAERYIEGQSYQENTLTTMHAVLGHQVYMIASPKYKDHSGWHCIEPTRYVNPYGVNVTILKLNTKIPILDRIIDTCVGLYEELCKINPDIIFLHGIEASDNRHIFRYKREHKNVKIYADNHNDYYNSHQNKLLNRLFAKFISLRTRKNNDLFEKFWGTTPWRMDYLEKVLKVDKSKIDLLLMGGDDRFIVGKSVEDVRSRIRGQYGIPSDAFLVVTGGNINKAKQQDILMEAVAQLKDKNVWLLLFGPTTPDMVAIVESYKKYRNIVIIGRIAPEMAYDMFLASDISCFPGTHSVLWDQAIACGIPGIFKSWEGMQYVNQGGNSLMLENVSVETIKGAIKYVLSKENYDIMHKRAAEVAPEFYISNLARKSIDMS